jgi:hypothetical protein
MKISTINFDLTKMLEFAAHPNNINSEGVTSSGHMEEIQELLLPKSNSNFSDG